MTTTKKADRISQATSAEPTKIMEAIDVEKQILFIFLLLFILLA